MNTSGAEFRQTRIEVLRFLASAEDQSDFAQRVHYDDYASEFLCWWIDDFFPDSPLFRSAFTAREIETLQCRSSEIDALDTALGSAPRTITQLHDDPNWLKVMAAAHAALEELNEEAT